MSRQEEKHSEGSVNRLDELPGIPPRRCRGTPSRRVVEEQPPQQRHRLPWVMVPAGFHRRAKRRLKVASTVLSLGKGNPGNGDVNPYGVAVVPTSTGKLVAGDVLVSNFNDGANNQGTGVTIMQISPAGKASVFSNWAHRSKGQWG